MGIIEAPEHVAPTEPPPVRAPAPRPRGPAPEPSIEERLGIGKVPRRRAWLRRWALWVIILAVLVTGALLWRARSRAGTTHYTTQPARTGDLTVTVSATGSLAPTDDVTVGSELSGLVVTVAADVNDRVRRGQLLVRLDTTKLAAQAGQARAALNAARAAVAQKQATLGQATAQLARMEQVYASSNGRVPAQQELDAQRAAVKVATADLASGTAAIAQAQNALQSVETDLSKVVIRSPIDGVVLDRNVAPGQTVAASFQAPTLFVIAQNLTQMQLTVDVDEADVGQVRAGQEAAFTVDAYPESTFTARVSRVQFASATVSGVVTYPTVLYVDNPNLLLRPGMTATARIVVQKVVSAVLVPNAALRFTPASAAAATSAPSTASRGGLLGRLMPHPPRSAGTAPPTNGSMQRVWVLRDGAPVPIGVQTGVTNGSLTQVRGGALQAGTAVIVDESTRGSSP